MPLICAVAGLFINVTLLAAMANFAWLKATALSGGQPFTAYLSLTAVQFGTPYDPTADNKFFCGNRGSCGLSALCAAAEDEATFPNGLPKSTPTAAWCAADLAGKTAAGFLWLALLLGMGAMVFTGMYASKEIEIVGRIVARVERLGFTDRIQKIVICGCWGVLWLFLFFTMTMYASMIPDTLGWGTVKIEASFGLLRLSFVLVSLFGALLTTTLFNLWNADNVVEAYMEFSEARLCSAKKFLYLELMFQLVLYLFLLVAEVDWSGLLIVLAAFYLDAKNKNFLLMYIVLVTISIFFDVIHAASLPSYDNMTPGESFGASMWTIIFIMKPVILATIYLYEKYEKEAEEGNGGSAWRRFDETGGLDHEIAE